MPSCQAVPAPLDSASSFFFRRFYPSPSFFEIFTVSLDIILVSLFCLGISLAGKLHSNKLYALCSGIGLKHSHQLTSAMIELTTVGAGTSTGTQASETAAATTTSSSAAAATTSVPLTEVDSLGRIDHSPNALAVLLMVICCIIYTTLFAILVVKLIRKKETVVQFLQHPRRQRTF